MKDQLSESMSAIMDSQADDLEVRRLLKALDNASEEEANAILAQWESFHTIGSALRSELIPDNGQTTVQASPDFAARVSAAIADESPVNKAQSVTSKNEPVWRRFAVAATVTLAVLVGVQEFESMQQGGDTNLTAENTEFTPAQDTAQPSLITSNDIQLASSAESSKTPLTEAEKLEAAKAQERLNEYLLEHTNHAAKQSGQGIIPFARLANFEDADADKK